MQEEVADDRIRDDDRFVARRDLTNFRDVLREQGLVRCERKEGDGLQDEFDGLKGFGVGPRSTRAKLVADIQQDYQTSIRGFSLGNIICWLDVRGLG